MFVINLSESPTERGREFDLPLNISMSNRPLIDGLHIFKVLHGFFFFWTNSILGVVMNLFSSFLHILLDKD